LGRPLPLENAYYVPAGVVLGGLGITVLIFSAGVLTWKMFYK